VTGTYLWSTSEMAKAKVLIVARTRMRGERVCVGALSDKAEHLRLMNSSCSSEIASKSPYRVGEWWEVRGKPCGEQKPPHVEDFAVADAARLGKQTGLLKYLLSAIDPLRGQSTFSSMGESGSRVLAAATFHRRMYPRVQLASGYRLPSLRWERMISGTPATIATDSST
jgi:hypothetical protein